MASTQIHAFGDSGTLDKTLDKTLLAARFVCVQLPHENSAAIPLTLYRRRWLVLAAFASLTFMNAGLWIAFAPVSTLTAEYYSISLREVDWFSMVFMVTYLTGSIPACWALTKYPAASIFAASLVTLGGSWMRYLAGDNFPVALAAQTIISLGQNFTLAAPPAIADSWFPDKERNLATAVATLANYGGWAVGYIVPTVMVVQKSDFPELLLWEAVAAAVSTVLILAFFRSKPPSPPSESATVHRLTFFSGVKVCLRSKRFLVLASANGLAIGVSYAVSTMLQQFALPAGFSMTEIGALGFAQIGAGVVTGLFLAKLMDNIHGAHHIILRVLFLFTSASLVVFRFSLTDGRLWFFLLSMILTGIGLIGFAPCAFDSAVEDTFPAPEASSAVLLNISGQLGGLIITNAAGYAGDFGPWVVVIAQCIGSLLLLAFYGKSVGRRGSVAALATGSVKAPGSGLSTARSLLPTRHILVSAQGSSSSSQTGS